MNALQRASSRAECRGQRLRAVCQFCTTINGVELTKSDLPVHRKVVRAVNGLTVFLEVERKRVPQQVLWDAQRLESLLFSGYDPDFEGDEPPGL